MSFENLLSKYDRIIFIDTETTGLDPKSCQIIELAAIRLTRKDEKLKLSKADMFVRLPEGENLPTEIISLTGITDALLEEHGRSEQEVAETFAKAISKPRTLLIAHNAQFDLSFLREMFRRSFPDGEKYLNECDCIDSLTVYKDRRAYPHRLENAVRDYNLNGQAQNSHRAIEDVYALYRVCRAMEMERNDLESYVNIFGYNPRYGKSGEAFPKITYLPQAYHSYMTEPNQTLPAIAREEQRRNNHTNHQKYTRRF